MTNRFHDRVVVVTGAASGIGLATTGAFLAEGATVAMVDLDGDTLASAHDDLVTDPDPSDRIICHPLDIRDTTGVAAALTKLVEDHGPLDHLVNCAASFVAAGVDASATDWETSLGTNVAGTAMVGAEASRRMRDGGTIVNVSSISAHAAQPDRWTYNATKAAILALTRGQAMDLAPRGIRVNAVSPGWIWTPEVERAAVGDREHYAREWGRFHLLNRLGEPAEVARAILFLSSDDASFITGTELLVDGGYTAMGPEGLGDSSRFAGSTSNTSN